jgi:Esterase/lipase
MSEINPQAESFLLTGPTDTACLFIHGFTASPSEVYPVARQLFEETDFSVSGPLLPGHGRTPREMNQTSWQDWFGRVEQEIDYLRRRHERVFITGLSMGGLLGLHAARQNGSLAGLIVINTPIFMKSSGIMALTPLLRIFRPYYPKKMDQAAEELADQGRFAYPVMPVKAFQSMHNLRRLVMREIPELNLPILVFQSSQDASVEPRSAAFIKEKAAQAPVKLIELKNSGHIATMGEEKELIVREIINFTI